MKKGVWLFIGVFLIGCASTPNLPSRKEYTPFSVRGDSYGVAPDAQYLVVVEDETFEKVLRTRLANYASYILDYRGFYETTIPEAADYYLVVSYKPYDSRSNQQYYQIAAVSKKVYDAVNEFKPRWWAASISYGEPKSPENMLAMHALAIRDVAGGIPNPYQVNASYLVGDELVLRIKRKVEDELRD